MKRLLLAIVATQLQGCLFVYIPGSVIDGVSDKLSGARGAYCVPGSAAVGDRINVAGVGQGTITSLSGTSYRCQEPHRPIRADITF